MQSLHLLTPDVVENVPAAQIVQELAPALGPVFVSEPAGQSLHGSSFDVVYLPTAQVMHSLRPL